MKKTRSIAFKLIFYILTSCTIIFAVSYGYNYYASRKILLKKIEESARNLTLATTNRIESVLRPVEKVPQNMASLLERRSYKKEELFTMLRSSVERNPEIYGATIAFEPYSFTKDSLYFAPYFYKSGNDVIFTFLGSDSYRYFFWDWYQIPKELNSSIWSEPYYDEGGGNAIMCTYSVPFYRNVDGERRFWGVVTADISLFWLQEIVSSIRIGRTGYGFLISGNGTFVTHPLESLIMNETVFGIAEARNEPRLRKIAQSMVRGDSGFVHFTSMVTGKECWMAYAPLPSVGWSIGVLFPKDELMADVTSLSRTVFIFGLIGLSFLFLLIVLISGSITRPVIKVAKIAKKISTGYLDEKVNIKRNDEIGLLAESFNEMISGLRERDLVKDTFSRYVTNQVAEELLKNPEKISPGGKEQEVTVVFADIRDFTAFSERHSPEEVISHLNEYLSVMIDVIFEYEGTLDKFIGDAVMAIWGAPLQHPDDPLRAVKAALEMQKRLEELNKKWASEGKDILKIGIGINTGKAIAGNIGNLRRMEYTVIGDSVNIASRIEGLTKEYKIPIIISSSTYEKVREQVEVTELESARIKGKAGLTKLYGLGGLKS